MSLPFLKAWIVPPPPHSFAQYASLFLLKILMIGSSTKGLTVYKGLKQADVHIGNWIAISGAGGGLGHLGKFYPR